MEWFNLAVMLDELAGQELILGLFLVGAGLVFLLMGVQLFKAIVAISFGVVGFVAGGLLPVSELAQLGCGLAGAVALAVASVYLVKLPVALLAGGWSALAVLGLISGFQLPDEMLWVFGLVAFAVGASLTTIMFQELVAFVTSLEGALLVLSGAVVFASQNPMSWWHLRSLLIDTPIFAPFLVVAVTVTGFYLQLTQARQKQSGQSG